jgi:hypothetical protein
MSHVTPRVPLLQSFSHSSSVPPQNSPHNQSLLIFPLIFNLIHLPHLYISKITPKAEHNCTHDPSPVVSSHLYILYHSSDLDSHAALKHETLLSPVSHTKLLSCNSSHQQPLSAGCGTQPCFSFPVRLVSHF